MTLEEAKMTIYANCIYACEKAGFDLSTICTVDDALRTVIAIADRKTENSSEKPNNCEPQTETKTETQNSNLTFEKRTMLDCYNCKRFDTEDECIECLYEPKDEPQTELVNDSPILVKDLVDDEFNPYDEECMRCKHLKLKCEFVPSYCKYEPRDEPRTEDLQDWKDRMWAEAVIEPQTDCPWR